MQSKSVGSLHYMKPSLNSLPLWTKKDLRKNWYFLSFKHSKSWMGILDGNKWENRIILHLLIHPNTHPHWGLQNARQALQHGPTALAQPVVCFFFKTFLDFQFSQYSRYINNGMWISVLAVSVCLAINDLLIGQGHGQHLEACQPQTFLLSWLRL